MKDGFYWARRKLDGPWIVVEVWTYRASIGQSVSETGDEISLSPDAYDFATIEPLEPPTEPPAQPDPVKEQ